MPVVINEFEVVPQAEPPNRQAETGQTAAPPPKPDRREVETIEERFRERMLRVWAH